jgi:anti-sigma B factor antagonist
MHVGVKILDNVAILTIYGNLMGGPETSALHEKVRHLIAEDITDIILDLHAVRWVSSAGLGVFLGCYTSLKRENGTLKMAHASDKVIQVLEITQLTPFFKMFDTVETALSSFHTEFPLPIEHAPSWHTQFHHI